MHRKEQYKRTGLSHAAERRREVYSQLQQGKREACKRARRAEGVPVTVAAPEVITQILHTLRSSSDRETRSRALKELRCQLSVSEGAPIDQTIQSGVLDVLVAFLTGIHAEDQLEAAWCLTNIASGSHEQCSSILFAVPHLIALLGCSNPVLQEQVAWALGNIAGDSDEYRVLLCANGALHPLVQLLGCHDLVVVRTVAWALSNLCRGGHAIEAIRAGSSDTLTRLFRRGAAGEASVEVAWLLTYLTATGDVGTSTLLHAGMAPFLAENVKSSNPQLVTPIVRTLGNVFSGSNDAVDIVLEDPTILPALLQQLNSGIGAVQRETGWAVSNVAASGPKHVDSLVLGGFVPSLVVLLDTCPFDVRKEAAYCLSNIAADGRHLPFLLECRALCPFLQMLTMPDVEMQRLALSFVELVCALIREGPLLVERENGITYLEVLQYSENADLRAKATDLVDRYWGVGDLDEEGDETEEQAQAAALPSWRVPPPSLG